MPEGNVSYIDLILSMVTKTAAEELSSDSEFRNYLFLYMSILHNFCGIVYAELPTMNGIVLAKQG